MGGTWGLAGSIPGTGDTVSSPACLRCKRECVFGPFLTGIPRRVVLRLVVSDCLGGVVGVVTGWGESRIVINYCALCCGHRYSGDPGTRGPGVPLCIPLFSRDSTFPWGRSAGGRGTGRDYCNCGGEPENGVFFFVWHRSSSWDGDMSGRWPLRAEPVRPATRRPQ